VIKKYTEDITWFCSIVNFALATDSPALYEMGEYVRDLQYCIYSLGKITDGVAYRGVNLTETELMHYEREQGPFYIPSFTSASLNSEMAFKKNSRLIIHTREDKGHGLYIKPEWSKYHIP